MSRLSLFYFTLIIIQLTLVNSCTCRNYELDKSKDSAIQASGNNTPPGNSQPTDAIDQITELLPSRNQGIPNIGNSCYMNATLQSVLSLFKDPLRKMEADSIKKTEGKTDLVTSVVNLLNEVTNPPTGTHDERLARLKSSSEAFFVNLIKSKDTGGLGWEGKCGTQEDALGFLISLLDWMQVPQIQTQYKLIDVDGHRERMASGEDPASILHLDFPGNTPITMQEVVDHLLQPEERVEVRWEETDTVNTKATKIPLLKGLNSLNTLVLNLNRAGLDATKNVTPVNNPFKIRIKKEQTLDLDSDKSYQLISFIQHIGSSGRSGHYISYVKVEGNQWVKYDDANVSTVSDKEAEKAASDSYVFVYQPANP